MRRKPNHFYCLHQRAYNIRARPQAGFGARALARFTPRMFRELKRPEGRAPNQDIIAARKNGFSFSTPQLQSNLVS
jgi:hypothetical protein